MYKERGIFKMVVQIYLSIYCLLFDITNGTLNMDIPNVGSVAKFFLNCLRKVTGIDKEL